MRACLRRHLILCTMRTEVLGEILVAVAVSSSVPPLGHSLQQEGQAVKWNDGFFPRFISE